MPIRILAADVANQIAAGEVVERPASAVKELIENSVDAGATDIRVEIREGGRRLIRVQDDGSGVPAGETELLFRRHATSKIQGAGDLDRLTTLGFRGEALASIGSVAQVTLLTCATGEKAGTLVRVAGGEEVGREGRGASPGTTITVEHLFANVPARLKFLKQAATEAGHIFQIVTRYALAYPERRFSLVSDGKLAFQSSGSGKLYDVLVKVYGLDVARQMLAIGRSGEEEMGDAGEEESVAEEPAAAAGQTPISVRGYVGIPALNRSNRSYITFFINRRWFQDNSLAYGVIQAYHTLLPVGRYPVALVFVEMDPGEVDVNVHPTKAEVRFRESRSVFGAVQRAVRQTLTEHAPIPAVDLGPGVAGDEAGAPVVAAQLSWNDAVQDGWAARHEALLAAGTLLPRREGNTADAQAGTGTERQGISEAEPAALPDLKPRKIPVLRVVGQLAEMYIVAEGPDGMYLIDQHAAHERILYEQLYAAHEMHKVEVQRLLSPVVLELRPEQAAAMGANLEALAELGVEVEPFGGQSYLLRAVPALLGQDSPERALDEILDALASESDLVAQTREARLITLICKRAAIKGGKVLKMAEMQEMVRQLEDCRSPRTCPHGRPTMVHVSAAELAKQFGRI